MLGISILTSSWLLVIKSFRRHSIFAGPYAASTAMPCLLPDTGHTLCTGKTLRMTLVLDNAQLIYSKTSDKSRLKHIGVAWRQAQTEAGFPMRTSRTAHSASVSSLDTLPRGKPQEAAE